MRNANKIKSEEIELNLENDSHQQKDDSPSQISEENDQNVGKIYQESNEIIKQDYIENIAVEEKNEVDLIEENKEVIIYMFHLNHNLKFI